MSAWMFMVISVAVVLCACRHNSEIESSGYNVLDSSGIGYNVQVFSSGRFKKVAILQGARENHRIQWEVTAGGMLKINGGRVVWRDGVQICFRSKSVVERKWFPVDSSIFNALNKDSIAYDEIERIMNILEPADKMNPPANP